MKITTWIKNQINESIEMKRFKCNEAREKRLNKIRKHTDRIVDQYMELTGETDRRKAEIELDVTNALIGMLFDNRR